MCVGARCAEPADFVDPETVAAVDAGF